MRSLPDLPVRRRIAGLTQRQMADALGVSVGRYHHLENAGAVRRRHELLHAARAFLRTLEPNLYDAYVLLMDVGTCAGIGPRLRMIRTVLDLSLRDLSKLFGHSICFWSKFEAFPYYAARGIPGDLAENLDPLIERAADVLVHIASVHEIVALVEGGHINLELTKAGTR